MLHCCKWVQKIIEGFFSAGICSNHIGYRFRSLWSCVVRTALSGLCGFQLIDLCFLPSVQLFSSDIFMHLFSPVTLFPNSKGVCAWARECLCMHQSGWPHSQSCLSCGHRIMPVEHITLLWGSNLFLLLCWRAICCSHTPSGGEWDKWMGLASLCHHWHWLSWHMKPLDLMEGSSALSPPVLLLEGMPGIRLPPPLALTGLCTKVNHSPKTAPWWRQAHTAKGYWFNQ